MNKKVLFHNKLIIGTELVLLKIGHLLRLVKAELFIDKIW